MRQSGCHAEKSLVSREYKLRNSKKDGKGSNFLDVVPADPCRGRGNNALERQRVRKGVWRFVAIEERLRSERSRITGTGMREAFRVLLKR